MRVTPTLSVPSPEMETMPDAVALAAGVEK
jgi:hypothetical protein